MMAIDPDNAVVRCCAEGIQLEMEGKIEDASRHYTRAWEIRKNDYEACIAAHYLARVQETTEDILRWNLEALACADKADDENIRSFYPSLYLNVGRAYEHAGNNSEALTYYRLAAGHMDGLPEDGLGNTTRDAINRGLQRVQDPSS
jgi:hypothetical protein